MFDSGHFEDSQLILVCHEQMAASNKAFQQREKNSSKPVACFRKMEVTRGKI